MAADITISPPTYLVIDVVGEFQPFSALSAFSAIDPYGVAAGSGGGNGVVPRPESGMIYPRR